MGIPSIEASEVGLTGLIWLFFSYGFVLYKAADLIGEGSELLLLVPSMAGLVGGVVLPLLGAVPDGAIVLFSGLSPDLAEAQETLAVGVGALAGSTIMLLTIPFALSIWSGRVDLLKPDYKTANYVVKPKLTDKDSIMDEIKGTGVALSDAASHGGVLMAVTTIPYFLIQVPAFFLHGPNEQVGKDEKWWALAGFIFCLLGLIIYMKKQLQISREGQDRELRMAIMKKVMKEGKMSLSGMISAQIRKAEKDYHAKQGTEYQTFAASNRNPDYPTPEIAKLLSDLVGDAFRSYDADNSGYLDKAEVTVFFRDFHETITDEERDELFTKYDTDNSGEIDFKEFIGLVYSLIKSQEKKERKMTDKSVRPMDDFSVRQRNSAVIAESTFAEETEEEEIPEEFTDLSPDEQQAAIKKRAFLMLLCGTVLVLLFSDPMVDVLAEIGARSGIPPFYVSFVLAPLASNASEFLASMYYASKKTRKTITVSITALEGAACMNNTFCLSIFMALIFFRGIAWQYTAETLAIILVELFIAGLVQYNTLSLIGAGVVLAMFPLSIALVAILEKLGFD